MAFRCTYCPPPRGACRFNLVAVDLLLKNRCQVSELRHPGKVYNALMKLILKLARYGLVHCDFNEFNLLITKEEEIILIDFPQMISTSHVNAEEYFDR